MEFSEDSSSPGDMGSREAAVADRSHRRQNTEATERRQLRQHSVKWTPQQTDAIRQRLMDAQCTMRRSVRSELLRLQRSRLDTADAEGSNLAGQNASINAGWCCSDGCDDVVVDPEAFFAIQCLGIDVGLDVSNPDILEALLTIQSEMEAETGWSHDAPFGGEPSAEATPPDDETDVDWEEYFQHLTV